MSHYAKIEPTPAQQDELQRRANSRTNEARVVERAKIIAGSAAGKAKQEIAEQPGIARQTVRRREKRFLGKGTKGLEDAPRSGRPRRIGPEQIAQIVHKTTQETPADSTHRSTRSLALVVKVSASSVGRIWRSARLKVHRVRTFKLSNDRQFAEKTDACVQLYLNPPPDSVVWPADEQCQLQALSRTQPGLPCVSGQRAARPDDGVWRVRRTGRPDRNADGLAFGSCAEPALSGSDCDVSVHRPAADRTQRRVGCVPENGRRHERNALIRSCEDTMALENSAWLGERLKRFQTRRICFASVLSGLSIRPSRSMPLNFDADVPVHGNENGPA